MRAGSDTLESESTPIELPFTPHAVNVMPAIDTRRGKTRNRPQRHTRRAREVGDPTFDSDTSPNPRGQPPGANAGSTRRGTSPAYLSAQPFERGRATGGGKGQVSDILIDRVRLKAEPEIPISGQDQRELCQRSP